MFGLFNSDPKKKLRKKYEQLLKEATDLQRKGDIQAYARKMEEAENIAKQLED